MLRGMNVVGLLLLVCAPDVAEQAAIVKKYAKQPYEQRQRIDAIGKLGRIGTPDSTKALEAVLDDPFGHVRDAAVSALIQLKRKRPEDRGESLELLASFLTRRRDPVTRRHIATALGLIGDLRAGPPLRAALRKEKDDDVIAALASALARIKDADAFGDLLQKAHRGPGRAHCVRALGALPNAAEAAYPFRHDKDDGMRAAVVDVLVQRNRDILPEFEIDAKAAVGVQFGIALANSLGNVRSGALARRRAAALLKNESWRVRAAALEAVVALRDPTLVGDVIDVLAGEHARLRLDAWRALRRLTGKDIGPDPGQWRALLPVRELPDGGIDVGEAKAGSAAYFSMPVFSERIAFVFDVSGSMRKGDLWGQARAQFKASAKQLAKTQLYDLFVLKFLLDYPPRPELLRCFKKLRPGPAGKAGAWLDRIEAKGGGALYDALEAAIADDAVDTIYLLSDGVPSYGTVSRGWRVVQEIRRSNRFRRVVVHGVMLGEGKKGREFMRELAGATGGFAVDAQGKPLG
jgi:HEAT repeat protein